MTPDLVTILQSSGLNEALANALLLVITGVVGLASKNLLSWIKAHTNAKQFELLQAIVSDAVQAAEQGKIAGYVADKKVAALNYASVSLEKAGLKVSAEQLSSAVESAVLREFNPAGDNASVVVNTTDTTINTSDVTADTASDTTDAPVETAVDLPAPDSK
jgi:hypothetical protein